MIHKSPITTHVLDTAAGRPAAGVQVHLERIEGDRVTAVGAGVTDADGRASDLMSPGTLTPGIFRLTFEVGAYHASLGQAGFYPRVPIVFEVSATDQHYHVPLLLNPFGYSTYRGS